MDNEFDFETEDLEFDDLGLEDLEEDLELEELNEDSENFEDFDEITEVQMRTAILSKNNMFALLCVKTATEGGAICRVDPREANPAVQLYDDPAKALEYFMKSLRTSRKNGWQVVYDGLPLQG